MTAFQIHILQFQVLSTSPKECVPVDSKVDLPVDTAPELVFVRPT